ncbi:MAG: hypothetical protein O2971_19485, partial [Proteobacteria bacterium]|nr:hypothetical protein [Pseudomonadota bacterium]
AQAMAVVLGKRVNTARQAPPVGGVHRVRSQRRTGLKGRPSCVRLFSEIGCKPERPTTCSEAP